jgi:DNA segregation ATPase FtsK/SpoIIIE, S-DNA-T family
MFEVMKNGGNKMDWFKKLYKRFSHDNEKSTTEPEVTSTQMISQKQHVEAKIAYQYPKGKFRFPLIPDEVKDTQPSEKPKRETIQRVANLPKSKDVRLPDKKSASKKQFKPTDVPSPIYGFGKPKKENENPTQENIIEFELFSSEADKSARQEIAVTSETRESNSHCPDTALEDVWEAEVKDNNEDSDELLELLQELKNGPLQGERPEVIREDDTIESPLAPTSETKKVEDVFLEEENSDSIARPVDEHETLSEQSTYESQSHRKHYIPYNVMMLKQDRQNLQKKPQEVTVQITKDEEVDFKNNETREPEQRRELEKNTSEVGSGGTNGQAVHTIGSYQFPSLQFLNTPVEQQEDDEEWLANQSELLNQTLRNFKVRATVVNVTQGPAVTRFEVHPEPGVKVNKITNLADDIKLSLAAKDIRIEAPIPGKNTIGIEVPNRKSKSVLLKEIIQSEAFISDSSPLAVALGLDISGKPVVTDLRKMPHGLIAGATGSGKSVCINTMLVSLLYKASPHEVKLLLIDPKMVELAPYNHIPHLVSPVITDVKAATAALKWAVEEMERRYELFAHAGVRDIARFNELVDRHNEQSGQLPYLVIIIDELADLMMVAPGDVEEAICRIAQKARACGIHLILATQRPSVDVITGLIKANIPTRIAFSVSSQVDSRTIIDTNGADKLLGKGDMLFLENGSSKPTRLQGNFVSDDEIERVVQHVKSQMKPIYMFEQDELVKKATIQSEEDDLFYEACEFVLDQGGASTSSLQRRFRIGYNRAARLIDIMEEQGIISEGRGSKPREILITGEELETIQETSTSTL